MKEFSSEKEVLALYKEKGLIYVIFEGSVYDITEYKDNHPGGASPIEEYYGMDIGEAFEEQGHSKSARKVFRDLPIIGYIAGNDFGAGKDKDINDTV